MDDYKVLEEARKTIEHIKATQVSLDEYLSRLEEVVSVLEREIKVDKKLTLEDVTSINETIVVKNVKDRKKRKFKFNWLLLLSLFSLMFTISLQYIKLNDPLVIKDESYFIYKQTNMEPSIKQYSLVSVNNDNDYNVSDQVAYYTKHKVIRIKEVSEIEEDNIRLVSTDKAIKAYEEVKKEDVLGKVSNTYYKQGSLLNKLLNLLIVFYILTIFLFVMGIIFH